MTQTYFQNDFCIFLRNSQKIIGYLKRTRVKAITIRVKILKTVLSVNILLIYQWYDRGLTLRLRVRHSVQTMCTTMEFYFIFKRGNVIFT